jgi:Mg-chelatase subunit ChlD
VGVDFLHPWYLLALLPAGCAIWWWYREERRLEGVRKKAVAVLRSLLFLFLILAVAGTSLKSPVNKLQTVFVVDESKSIDTPGQAVQWIQDALLSKKPEDGWALLGAGEKPSVEYPFSDKSPAAIELGGVKNPNFTNLAGGLRLSEGLLDSGYRPRVVLLSDGEQNVGDAIAEAAMLKERGIRVDVVPLKRTVGTEVLVHSVNVPANLYQGEQFAMNAVVDSTVATEAQVRVYEDDQVVATTSVSVQKGETRISIPLSAKKEGFHRYRVELQSDDDTITANNTAYAFGEVAGRPQVLIVEGKADDSQWLSQALKASGMSHEIVPVSKMPDTLEKLRRYAVLVLANVPATEMPEPTQKAIETAVRDLGMGLLMTGGQDSFGLGGYFETPVEKALPVYMDLRNKKETPSLGLMLVIDRSGSMEIQKMEIAKEGARRAAAMLGSQDTLGVVAFDSFPWWVVDPAKVTDKQAVQDKISSIHSGGGTDIYPSLADAFEKLKTVEAKRKHIILLTDGRSAMGDYPGLIAKMKEQGITLSTVGVGADTDVSLLEYLAKEGGGRFYLTTNSSNVPQIFTKETAMAGKTYILDQPFLPEVGRLDELRPLVEKGLPRMGAMIATTAKETADVLLSHPGEGEPLLARWQYGLGRSVAWTSDAKGVWANEWAAWSGSSPFWNQLLTWMLPQYQNSNMDLRAGVTAGQGQLQVKLKSRTATGSTLKAQVIDEEMNVQEVPLLLKSPGEYTGTYAASRPGTYMVKVVEEQNGKPIGAASTGVSVSYSPEYQLPKAGDDLLAQIAAAGGGEVLSDPSDAFADNLPSRWAGSDLSLFFLLLTACIWPFDVALRRLNLSFGFLSGRFRVRTESMRVMGVGHVSGVLQKVKAHAIPPAQPLQKGVSATSSNSSSAPLATPAKPAQDDNTISRLLDKKRKR